MFETQYIILILIFTLTIVVYIFQKKKPKNYPPGPLSLPIIGGLHHLGLEPQNACIRMSKIYGNVFSIDLASYPAVVLNDYECIEEAFNNDAFAGRPSLRPFLQRCGDGVARGVAATDGKNWIEQRRFLLKTLRDFGYGKSSMENLIQEELQELVEIFQSDIGKPIYVMNKFAGPVINSLWHIVTGKRFAYDDPKFKNTVYDLTEAMAETKYGGASFFFPTLTKIFPTLTGYNQVLRLARSGVDIIEETIKQHKDTFQDDFLRDLIDAYIQEILNTKNTQSSFYREEGELNLKIVLSDLFLAGVETTSTVLTWIFSILAQKNDEQEKLYSEIKQVVGLSRRPTLSDRERMPYTEAIIMEVMRFASILPIGVFHNTMQDVNFKGYFIPKNTLIIYNLYAVLRDPNIWGDPNVFRPDRFLLNGKLKRHHNDYIPFSIGKRICPGEVLAKDELFLFVTTLFQKFQVFNDPSQPIPSLNDSISGVTRTPIPHALILQER